MTPSEDRFGDVLKGIGDAYLAGRPADPLVAQRESMGRAERRRRVRLWTGGLAATAAVVAFALVMALVVPRRAELPPFPAGPISTIEVGNAPESVAVTADAVIVGHAAGDEVRVVDPGTGETRRLGVAWSNVGAGESAVWGLDGAGVAECDLDSGLCSSTVDAPSYVLLHVSGDAVYAADLEPSLIRHGDGGWARALPEQRVSAISAHETRVAVATTDGSIGRVLLLDPESGDVLSQVRVGREIEDLAWVDGELWGVSAGSGANAANSGRSPSRLFRFGEAGEGLTFETFGIGTDRISSIAAGDGLLWGASESAGIVAGYQLTDGARLRGPLAAGVSLTDLAVGHGALWATDLEADALVRIDPAAVPPAEEDVGEPCDRISFRPTYVPLNVSGELQPGSGGGGDLDGVIGHWPGPAEGVYIDVFPSGAYYAQSPGTEADIEVLGNPATIGAVEDGYSVELSHRGCDYAIYGFGVPRPDLRKTAEGLRPAASEDAADECRSRGVPFRAADPPAGWPSEAGPPDGDRLGVYELPEGRSISVYLGDDVAVAYAGEEPIDVMNRPGLIASHDEGELARFTHRGCEYVLLTTPDVRTEEFRQFVESFEQAAAGDPEDREGFAVWPAATAAQGEEACASSAARWPTDRVAVARRFAAEVVGWESVRVRGNRRDGSFALIDLQLDRPDGPRPTIELDLAEFYGCWFVTHVNDEARSGASYTVHDDVVTLAFEARGHATAEASAEFNGEEVSTVVPADEDTVTLQFDDPIVTEGAVVLLFRDAEGVVVSVWAAALAPGDAAG